MARSSALSVRSLVIALLLGMVLGMPPRVQGQQLAKYGADFLAGGVGARAIGLGGAYVGLADDVTAGYWNAAGLSQLQYPEVGYMHVERFGGVVSFDYGGVAFPLNERSTVGLTAVRSGVNDIVNTLNAYNPDLGQPTPNYRAQITRFSAADYLFGFSYAYTFGQHVAAGLTGKVSRRSIGAFADAWGYSADVGLQYRTGSFSSDGAFVVGVSVQDALPYIQSWSVNPTAFEVSCINPETEEPYEACKDAAGNLIESNAVRYDSLFSQQIPEGQTELVTPTARLGLGVTEPVGEAGSRVTLGLGVDVRFDGRRAYLLNLGEVSFEPRLGAEFSHRGIVAIRGGINRVQYADALGWDLTPSVGAGLNLDQFSINYAFGDFSGASSDLGYSHRISARLRLAQPGLERGGEE